MILMWFVSYLIVGILIGLYDILIAYKNKEYEHIAALIIDIILWATIWPLVIYYIWKRGAK